MKTYGPHPEALTLFKTKIWESSPTSGCLSFQLDLLPNELLSLIVL